MPPLQGSLISRYHSPGAMPQALILPLRDIVLPERITGNAVITSPVLIRRVHKTCLPYSL